jgi:beta-glucosidase-like glycosyl hydrolase
MNRVNGTIGCENEHIQNTVLKRELGFNGVTCSTHSNGMRD